MHTATEGNFDPYTYEWVDEGFILSLPGTLQQQKKRKKW